MTYVDIGAQAARQKALLPAAGSDPQSQFATGIEKAVNTGVNVYMQRKQQQANQDYLKQKEDRQNAVALTEKGFMPATQDEVQSIVPQDDGTGNVVVPANAANIFQIPGSPGLGYWKAPQPSEKEQADVNLKNAQATFYKQKQPQGETTPYQQRRLDLQDKKYIGSTIMKAQTEPLAQKIDQGIFAADKGIGIANNKDIQFTPQIATDMENDVTSMLSAARGTNALADREKQELDSYQRQFTQLMQKVRNKPQEWQAPEYKAQLVKVFTDLKSSSQKARIARFDKITSHLKRQYQGNQDALDTIQAGRDSLGSTEPSQETAPPVAGASSQPVPTSSGVTINPSAAEGGFNPGMSRSQAAQEILKQRGIQLNGPR